MTPLLASLSWALGESCREEQSWKNVPHTEAGTLPLGIKRRTQKRMKLNSEGGLGAEENPEQGVPITPLSPSNTPCVLDL